METTEPTYQACPDCGAVLPVHRGYVTWCDQCGWNVSPHQPDPPRNIYESIYASLGRRQSQSLLDRLAKAERIRPTFTLVKLAAFGLATLVHGITVAFAGAGLLVLLLGWPKLPAIAGGLVLLLIAWVVRPRMDKPPEGVVPRADYATLYRLVDTIGESLGAHPVDGILINQAFNAEFGQAGWRRRRFLWLGLPLWSILDDQERVALLAHELAHSVNGDPARGFYIGSAIESLCNWYAILRPAYILGRGLGDLFELPFKLVLLSLSGLAWFGVYVLVHLIWQDSQRAEYLADYLASTVSGTEASLSLLHKQHFRQPLIAAARRIMLAKEADQHFFQKLHQLMLEVPERELARIERVEQMAQSRLDVTHPPTANRIKFLQPHPSPWPQVSLPLADSTQVQQELGAVERIIGTKLDVYLVDPLYW